MSGESRAQSLTVVEREASENYEEMPDILPEKLSIRQYLDQNLMPTLLPALNQLAAEK